MNEKVSKEVMYDLAYRNDRDVITGVKSKSTPQSYPDAKKHQIVSFIKSGVRILGYCAILLNIEVAVALLVISEVIGIFEEMV